MEKCSSKPHTSLLKQDPARRRPNVHLGTPTPRFYPSLGRSCAVTPLCPPTRTEELNKDAALTHHEHKTPLKAVVTHSQGSHQFLTCTFFVSEVYSYVFSPSVTPQRLYIDTRGKAVDPTVDTRVDGF